MPAAAPGNPPRTGVGCCSCAQHSILGGGRVLRQRLSPEPPRTSQNTWVEGASRSPGTASLSGRPSPCPPPPQAPVGFYNKNSPSSPGSVPRRPPGGWEGPWPRVCESGSVHLERPKGLIKTSAVQADLEAEHMVFVVFVVKESAAVMFPSVLRYIICSIENPSQPSEEHKQVISHRLILQVTFFLFSNLRSEYLW